MILYSWSSSKFHLGNILFSSIILPSLITVFATQKKCYAGSFAVVFRVERVLSVGNKMRHSLASNILVYDFKTAEPPFKEFLLHNFKLDLKFTGCFMNRIIWNLQVKQQIQPLKTYAKQISLAQVLDWKTFRHADKW